MMKITNWIKKNLHLYSRIEEIQDIMKVVLVHFILLLSWSFRYFLPFLFIFFRVIET